MELVKGGCDALNRLGALLDAAHQAALGGTPSPDTCRPAEKPDFEATDFQTPSA
jgi:hypothetical protein